MQFGSCNFFVTLSELQALAAPKLAKLEAWCHDDFVLPFTDLQSLEDLSLDGPLHGCDCQLGRLRRLNLSLYSTDIFTEDINEAFEQFLHCLGSLKEVQELSIVPYSFGLSLEDGVAGIHVLSPFSKLLRCNTFPTSQKIQSFTPLPPSLPLPHTMSFHVLDLCQNPHALFLEERSLAVCAPNIQTQLVSCTGAHLTQSELTSMQDIEGHP